MKELLPTVRVSRYNFRTVSARIRYSARRVARNETSTLRVIADVQQRGDSAVQEYTRKFDGVSLRQDQLRVSVNEISESVRRVDDKLISALRLSLRNLQALQVQLLSRLRFLCRQNGFNIRLAIKPLSSVGCYVPGGKAAYPSTVLMTAGLARLTGVRRIAICTPPDSTGKVNDAILAAANLCEVDEVYRCGGPQAIAALAYGTETIAKVEKIVGPGGTYVALAKKLVSRDVTIDFFAGPTELLVAADKTTDPNLVAWDLIAQAEHGPDSLSGLVTCSQNVAERVRTEIKRLMPRIQRRKYVEASLRRGFAAVCGDWETACNFVNEVAPEHLELLTHQARNICERIDAAGLIFIGENSPAAASDYCIGTNHVLPTNGFAKSNGGLTALDFVKPTWVVQGSRKGLRSILEPLCTLASAEGLINHYYSVESRFAR